MDDNGRSNIPVPSWVPPHQTMPSHVFKHHVANSMENVVLRLKGESSSFGNAKMLTHAIGDRVLDPSVCDGTRHIADRFVGWGVRKIDGFKTAGNLCTTKIQCASDVLNLLDRGRPISPETLRSHGYQYVLSKAYSMHIGSNTGEFTTFLDIGGSNTFIVRTTQDIEALGVGATSIQDLIDPNCQLWKSSGRDFLMRTNQGQETIVLKHSANATKVAKCVAIIAVIVSTSLYIAKTVLEGFSSAETIKYAIDLGLIYVGYSIAMSAAATTAAGTLGLSMVVAGIGIALHCLVDWVVGLISPKVSFHYLETVLFSTYFETSAFSHAQEPGSFATSAQANGNLTQASKFALEQKSNAFIGKPSAFAKMNSKLL